MQSEEAVANSDAPSWDLNLDPWFLSPIAKRVLDVMEYFCDGGSFKVHLGDRYLLAYSELTSFFKNCLLFYLGLDGSMILLVFNCTLKLFLILRYK